MAPKLRVVGRAGVGLDNIDVPACRHRGVEVVYTPDANTQAVVEYVFALIFDAIRPRHTLDGFVQPEEFHRLRKVHVGRQLDTLTLGILGMGRIGTRVGRAASALGVRVIAHDILPEHELRGRIEYPFEFVDRATLLARADVLTIHVDGRPENRHLINADALAGLNRSCLFINAARGVLVDNTALADWARRAQAHGGGAVLDVHEPEPPPRDYPLFHLPNVRLLPHLASRTPEALENMSWVVRDVISVLRGEKPRFPAP
jgi:phosphoglycerate dehydrogenase-like enzyme